jgi:hypothetical protein
MPFYRRFVLKPSQVLSTTHCISNRTPNLGLLALNRNRAKVPKEHEFIPNSVSGLTGSHALA